MLLLDNADNSIVVQNAQNFEIRNNVINGGKHSITVTGDHGRVVNNSIRNIMTSENYLYPFHVSVTGSNTTYFYDNSVCW